MSHREYVVKPGDSIASIASDSGLFPETIWDDAKNSQLKDQRKNPYVLEPGDVVFVPEKREKEEPGATGERHRFRRKGVPDKFEVQFKIGEEPRADAEFVLTIDGISSDEKTDGDGRAEFVIPPDATKGRVIFKEGGDEFELELGKLNPIGTVEGVRSRLENLGYLEGSGGRASRVVDEALEAALKSFQHHNDLEVSGEIDDATRDKLESVYGF